ncbi:MAG: glycosyltransferase family 2 protein [Candidatus Obscuribacterales bacterium]|nr:glycosyltransferase family 2 protein [Candidatus Obscuribacterales bacterium]
MSKLAVVIPCYNEAKNIPLILERFQSLAPRADVELLILDNGSKDDSPQVIEQLLPHYSFAKTARVKVNQGYGYGIVEGLKCLTSDYVGWTHADMQTDPNDILRALEIIEFNNDPLNIYVKGQRRGRPLMDNVFTCGMSFFESVYLGGQLWDINAQPNIFHRTFFEAWKSPPHDFSLDLYALYMAQNKGLKVHRFDVEFTERIHGTSNWNTSLGAKWKFIKRTLDYSIKLKTSLSKEM